MNDPRVTPGAGPCAGREHNPRCTIDDHEHGGSCDTRSEAERWAELYRLLDGNLPGELVVETIERNARASWGAS